MPVGAPARARAPQRPCLSWPCHTGSVPLLWLALFSPVVLLVLMLAMERVEHGVVDTDPDIRSET